jgi:hypothetical protein
MRRASEGRCAVNEAIAIDRRELGWVKLSRKLLDNPLFSEKPHCWLTIWMLLMLKANWKDREFLDGTEPILVSAGSLVTSADKLAASSRTTRQTVRSCLEYLEKTKSITIKTTKRWTMITIANWAAYGSMDQSGEPTGLRRRS